MYIKRKDEIDTALRVLNKAVVNVTDDTEDYLKFLVEARNNYLERWDKLKLDYPEFQGTSLSPDEINEILNIQEWKL